MTGRPLPHELHRLHGNPGRRKRATPPKAKPLPALPEPPVYLSEEAQAEWRIVVRELHALRLLTELDRGLLEAWCAARGDFICAEKVLRNEGLIIKDRDGRSRRSPMLLIRNKALEQMRALAIEFGFSPRSRSGIARPPAAPHDDADPGGPDGVSLKDFLAEDPG